MQSADMGLPRVIDRYELLAVLGAGAFATVYRARHLLTRQHVAVKVLRRPDDMAQRWLAEARAAASIQHRNVVRVLDCGYADGEVFLVMDLADGPTLAKVLEHGPIHIHRAVDIALQVLDGLAVAHARGVVHRDIKPPNIVLSRESDGSDLARILDFGVSKELARFEQSATLDGTSIGTPGYMAPELFGDAKTADARADVYAVAAMLYEMLSGRLPFVGRSYEDFVVQVATRPPTPLLQVAPHVPPTLAAAIDHGLARDRDARWPSAEAFAIALRGGALSLPPPSPVAFEPTLEVRSQPRHAGSVTNEPIHSTLRTAPPPVVSSGVRPPESRTRTVPLVLGVVVLVALAAFGGVWVALRTMRPDFATSAIDTTTPPAKESKPVETAAAATTEPTATEEPTPIATIAPATHAATAPTTHGGIKFKTPRIVGQTHLAAMEALEQDVVLLAQQCRPVGTPVTCRVQLFVQEEGTITIAKPTGEPGNEAAAACLATYFKQAATPATFKPGGGGIVTVEATLDPR